MKQKKSHHESSSDDSEDSDDSVKSVSSSDSDSDDSSPVVDRRHKKKKKHADSSLSESGSEELRRSKKRKHKKKKKKHAKKRRRAVSGEDSESEISSDSEGEIVNKKKRKHRHKRKDSKRARSDSPSVKEVSDEEIDPRRVHIDVKDGRGSSAEGSQPSHTYYQKEYHHLASADDYESNREREVDRFYRGSSKERRHAQQQAYEYQRQHSDRYQQDKYAKNRERYGPNPHYNAGGDQYHNRKPKEYDDKRHQRYDEPPHSEEYQRRSKPEVYHQRESHEGPPRGYHNRYNQYEQRGPRGRNFEENKDYHKDYRERRGHPEQHSYHGREYPDKREKYREEGYSDRRDSRREDRPDKSSAPPRRVSVSPVEASRDIKREPRPERERYGEERRDKRPRPDTSVRPRERKSRFAADGGKEFEWGKVDVKKENDAAGDKEKPNFGLSGKLTAEANTVNGVVLKYTEPDDAKQPKRRWRFYPFKGDKALPILYIHRQSCFVMGRDKKVVDIHLEHPSVSKQHAALQFRATPFTRPDGSQGRRVRPYVIDLDSANGTFVNNKKVDPRRYVELLERDVVKFGFSAREYVLLHENSKDDAMDDDNQDTAAAIGANVTTTEQIKQEKRSKKAAVEDGE